MIQPVDYGKIRFFRMARTYFGHAPYWTGVYFIDGLLIDSGAANLTGEVRELFGQLEIRTAVTTHHHEDHCGNNHLLETELGITPLMHPRGIALVGSPEKRPHLYRRAIWSVPPPSRATSIDESVETDSFHFEVVPTPGHSPDHIALFEPERRWLFSGDLYLGPKLRVLRSDEDLIALMESLRRVIALEPEVLFCQHRGRVKEATKMLQLKLDFLTELVESIEALRQRGLSPKAIAGSLPGNDFWWRLGTGGHFSKLNFVRSFLASGSP